MTDETNLYSHTPGTALSFCKFFLGVDSMSTPQLQRVVVGSPRGFLLSRAKHFYHLELLSGKNRGIVHQGN